MNSERRHELQHNLLADYLGQWVKAIEPYTKQIAIAFVAIVVAVVAWGLYRNSAMMARSDATLELLQNASSSDAEALAAVSERYAETPAGVIARLIEADSNMGAGVASLYTDREDAETRIEDAADAYRDVTRLTKDKLLLSRAHFGLGHALESLGKVDEAVDAYQQVMAINESDAIVNAAQQRMNLLEKSETQEFLTWFAKQDFSPADPSAPPSMPGSASLPDLPDLDLPEITPMKVPDELKSDAEAETKPAPGDITLPPADTDAAAPSAADAAADDKPAQTPAPAAPATTPEPPAETPEPSAEAPKPPAETETPAADVEAASPESEEPASDESAAPAADSAE
ncbi:MAG: tetratricopeptide repeat protein [Planctomycetaceae bacterium]